LKRRVQENNAGTSTVLAHFAKGTNGVDSAGNLWRFAWRLSPGSEFIVRT
jgi:hypothetical protein